MQSVPKLRLTNLFSAICFLFQINNVRMASRRWAPASHGGVWGSLQHPLAAMTHCGCAALRGKSQTARREERKWNYSLKWRGACPLSFLFHHLQDHPRARGGVSYGTPKTSVLFFSSFVFLIYIFAFTLRLSLFTTILYF